MDTAFEHSHCEAATYTAATRTAVTHIVVALIATAYTADRLTLRAPFTSSGYRFSL
jgi:hypothetical protein